MIDSKQIDMNKVDATPIDALSLPPPLLQDTDEAWLLAALKALADPTRLHIVQLLAAAGQTCVCNLPARVDIPQNLLSHHLKVLREAGLVTATRRGRWVDYAANDTALERLRALIPSVASTVGGCAASSSPSSGRTDAHTGA